MAASDLASLQDVKDWLAGGGAALGSADNAALSRLITMVSGAIYAHLGRQVIIPQSIVERYDGVGNQRILLRNWPVLSVSGLIVDGVSYAAGMYPTSASTGAGWPPSGFLVSPWDGLLPGRPQILDYYSGNSVSTFGGIAFSRGRQNIQVSYRCGYQVSNEVATVPASGLYTIAVQAPLGPWASDAGVTYANGTALKVVASSPSVGQYIPPTQGSQSEGAPVVYTFSAADASAGVLISYGFVPAALNGACIEWVAERVRYRSRIGQKAQTVAGQQTASYDLKGMPDFVKELCMPYKNVVPFSLAWA